MEFLLLAQNSPLKFSFECDHHLLCVVSKKLLDVPEIEQAFEFGQTILDQIPDYIRERTRAPTD